MSTMLCALICYVAIHAKGLLPVFQGFFRQELFWRFELGFLFILLYISYNILF
jgi:hypothetical protein